MTYKDITPTYNVNRKVVNFGDFCKTCEEPKLKKMKRQTTPNSDERQKLQVTLNKSLIQLLVR